MQLYNSLTKQAEAVEPLDGQAIRIYSCGPTVYDHIHIGNLSSFIFADTLRRAVTLSGQKAKHVMNITDVDDKTIKRSRQEFAEEPPMEALLRLTNQYSQTFLDDMAAVGNDDSGFEFIKATDSIESMQDLISELHEKGFAYIAADGVYFSIEAYKKSGKTYGQLTEVTVSSTSEARIQNDEYDKESAHDFALWKKHRPGEPSWDFELDGHNLKGRPGWHIECSAMSRQLLSQPFDIHTGGVDLIFPHHENEIAQSTAGSANPLLAKLFAHNEHLLVDGQKMSKSLNNFYSLEDIKAKGYDPLAFRLLVLQGHYRKQGHFSWENLTAAQNRLKSWQALADLRWQMNGQEPAADFDWEQPKQLITDGLQTDLNTPQALMVVDKLADQADQIAALPASQREQFESLLEFLDDAFGLKLSHRQDISEPQKDLLTERDEARLNEDWQLSDELRDRLKEQGIGLRDTASGAIWYRQR